MIAEYKPMPKYISWQGEYSCPCEVCRGMGLFVMIFGKSYIYARYVSFDSIETPGEYGMYLSFTN